MEDEARARRRWENGNTSHLKSWTCKNGEESALELAMMHGRKRKRPKFETLDSNILKCHLKIFQYATTITKIPPRPLNRRSPWRTRGNDVENEVRETLKVLSPDEPVDQTLTDSNVRMNHKWCTKECVNRYLMHQGNNENFWVKNK